MAQTEQRGLGHRPAYRPSLRALVMQVVVLGLLGASAVIAIDGNVSFLEPRTNNAWVVAGLFLLAVLAEVIVVPLRRGEGFEQLALNGATMVIAVLVLQPWLALVVPLAGLVIAEIVLGRPLVKIVFNLGHAAFAGSLMIIIYALLAADQPWFSWQSVLTLVIASLTFEATSLFALAGLWWSLESDPPLQTIRSEIPITLVAGVGNVALATVLLSTWRNEPVLLPFALAPAWALWSGYQFSAQTTESRQRSAWLVQFGQTVSSPGSADEVVPPAIDALRRMFGAEQARLVLPDGRVFTASRHDGPEPEPDLHMPQSADLAARHVAGLQPVDLPTHGLPDGWVGGSVVQLRTEEESEGAPHALGVLMLGTRSKAGVSAKVLPWLVGTWRLSDADRPVFAALAASLAASLRAGSTLTSLIEETARLSTVVDNATDGIAVLDPSGRALIWSPAMRQLTGVSPQQAGQATDRPEAVQTIFEAARGQAPQGTTSISLSRGKEDARELDISVTWIDHIEAGETQAILTVRDMTRERRAERLKSDFIATVSHELRTPITPIKGYAQLMLTKKDKLNDAKREKIIRSILDRADHLARLVDDLLIASRASDASSRAKLAVDLQDVPLTELVDDAHAHFPEHRERLTIEWERVPDDLVVRADRQRALQCLTNLLSNAVKYSPDSAPIRVFVSAEPLVTDSGSPAAPTTADGPAGPEADSASVPSLAWVHVQDLGRGIPEDEQSAVFDRFYRVEDPMTMTTGGSGLGLFIARELARAMGGDITLSSRVGVGSTFSLGLPVVSEAEQHAVVEAETGAVQPTTPAAGEEGSHHG